MNWYVVYTKPRWEKKVAATLTDKGIENYCPLNKVTKQWTDRKKVVLEPLFKGYVFVSQDAPDVLEIKKTDGILNFVFRNGKPGIVRGEEMDTIRKFLDEYSDVSVTDLSTVVNDMVLIKQGLLMDHKGTVIELSGNRAKVRIDSMGVQLTAVFERKNLVKLK